MTMFGPDVSSYQGGLRLASLAVCDFVIVKATEGTYYTDAQYANFRQQCIDDRRLFIWYHFLSAEGSAAQVAHTRSRVGDYGLPGMLDAEPNSVTGFRPTTAQIRGYVQAAHADGLNLRLLYLPRWYWQELGEPDLTWLDDADMRLVSSSYVSGSAAPTALYPGDSAAGWRDYGGVNPLLYQFTEQASGAGHLLDYNACREGDLASLERFLYPTATTGTGDNEVTVTFSEGQVRDGVGAVTLVTPPPSNTGSNWGPVWFSLGTDFADAHVRVAVHVHGKGWVTVFDDVLVARAADRMNPFGGPLPDGTQKISITRKAGTENVPMGYLIEARSK